MNRYTGIEYLYIDIANHYGLDKEQFEKRIQFIKDNINNLEALQSNADKPAMYMAGVMALRDYQKGKETGYLISLDACSSGVQIMSAITGCLTGAANSGITGNKRMDFYKEGTNEMSKLLGSSVNVIRKKFKQASMTYMYGSEAEPESLFGKGKELRAFYKAQANIAPKAVILRDYLINAWDSKAFKYEWILPDGFNAICKVICKEIIRVEIDEMNHHKFNHTINVNRPKKKDKSLAANVIHSIDAFILREMVRRCNYGDEIYDMLSNLLLVEEDKTVKTDKFISIKYRTKQEILKLSTEEQIVLKTKLDNLIKLKSFPIITIHDDFRCHPNNGNLLRYHYKEILAELAESNILASVLKQITGKEVKVNNKSSNLGDLIRNSEYCLS